MRRGHGPKKADNKVRKMQQFHTEPNNASEAHKKKKIPCSVQPLVTWVVFRRSVAGRHPTTTSSRAAGMLEAMHRSDLEEHVLYDGMTLAKRRVRGGVDEPGSLVYKNSSTQIACTQWAGPGGYMWRLWDP